jgi:hypothetical protein
MSLRDYEHQKMRGDGAYVCVYKSESYFLREDTNTYERTVTKQQVTLDNSHGLVRPAGNYARGVITGILRSCWFLAVTSRHSYLSVSEVECRPYLCHVWLWPPDDRPGLLGHHAVQHLAVNAHKLGTINWGTMNEQPGVSSLKMDEGNIFSSNSSVGSFSFMSCSPL